jgi:hypothetical protein
LVMDPSLVDLFKSISEIHEVDYYWMRAIVRQESHENVYALRYETTYNYLLNPIQYSKTLNITLNTEITTQKMSWGLCQMMGALAREQGFIEEMGKFFDPMINLTHLGIRLAHLKKISSYVGDVAAMYNGGEGAHHLVNNQYRNQKYVDAVVSHITELRDEEKYV